MTIIILATAEDLHADAIIDCIKDRANAIRINIGSHNGNFFYDSDSKAVIIDDRLFSIDEISGIYCRVPLELKLNNSLGSEIENYRSSEFQAALRGVMLLVPAEYWINYPWFESFSDGKIYPLNIARQLGISVPPFIVTNSLSKLDKWLAINSDHAVIKQISETGIAFQYGKFVDIPDFSEFHAAYTTAFDRTLLNEEIIDSTPFMVQKRIDKLMEYRVVVIDSFVFASKIIVDSEDMVDQRLKSHRIESTVSLPSLISKQIIELRAVLRLRFMALDFLIDNTGQYWLVDINPSGNWLWQELQLELGITQAITSGLINAE